MKEYCLKQVRLIRLLAVQMKVSDDVATEIWLEKGYAVRYANEYGYLKSE